MSGADLRGAISAANAWVNESGCDCVACIVRAAFQYCAPALRWRREPPDAPGWWWVRESQRPSARIRHCTEVDCEWFRTRLAGTPGEERFEWAGPIAEPEEGEQ